MGQQVYSNDMYSGYLQACKAVKNKEFEEFCILYIASPQGLKCIDVGSLQNQLTTSVIWGRLLTS